MNIGKNTECNGLYQKKWESRILLEKMGKNDQKVQKIAKLAISLAILQLYHFLEVILKHGWKKCVPIIELEPSPKLLVAGKWGYVGKNGLKLPKSRKNCQIGHQSGNFAGITLAGGHSVALMDQVRAHTIIGILPWTVGGCKMGVKGEKNGPKVAKMAKLAILRLSSSPSAFLMQCGIKDVTRL